MKKQWTEAELSALKNWYSEGVAEQEIARRLGRTIGSVSNARQLHKITRPLDVFISGAPWSKDDLILAKYLYECGMSLDIISQKVGRTYISIKRMANEKRWIRPSSFGLTASWFDSEAESWRPAYCYGYAVSSIGSVMSLQPGLAGKLLKKWRDSEGYEHVALTLDGVTRRHSVHRLVAISFLESMPVGDAHVAHINGVPWENNVSNLRWSTASENQRDRVEHGTALRGEHGKFIKVWDGDRVNDVRRAI